MERTVSRVQTGKRVRQGVLVANCTACVVCEEPMYGGDGTKIRRINFGTHIQPRRIHDEHPEESDGTVRVTTN